MFKQIWPGVKYMESSKRVSHAVTGSQIGFKWVIIEN